MQVSGVGVVALGAMLVLISGGIDLSAGYCVSLAGMTAGYFYTMSANTGIVLVVVAILVGAVVGLVNGLIITKMKLHPFIVTLAMMSVCQGFSLMLTEGRHIVVTSPGLLVLGQSRFLGMIPVCFILYIAIAFVMWVLCNKTRQGVYTYAIGGNEDAVFYSGINQNFYKTMVYVIAGICFGIGAIIISAQVTIVSISISGSVLLDGIAGAVIGGTSLMGGRGTVVGTVIGTFILTLISTLLTFLGIPPLLRDALKGCVIIGVLLFDVAINKISDMSINTEKIKTAQKIVKE